jgi:hypothetical protein
MSIADQKKRSSKIIFSRKKINLFFILTQGAHFYEKAANIFVILNKKSEANRPVFYQYEKLKKIKKNFSRIKNTTKNREFWQYFKAELIK